MALIKSSISRISVFFLIAIIIGGFPNYMIQEAYATTPTISAVTGSSASGDSTATTNIIVTFNTGVNATTADTAAAWAVVGNTVSSVTSILNDDVTCNGGSGGTLTLTITLGTALATGAVPVVTYNGTGPNISIKSCNSNDALVNASSSAITPVDGLRPVASSAATTDSTTIVITMSEDVTNNAAVAGDFAVTGIASNPSISSIGFSGSSITLNLSAAIVSGDTSIEVAYTGDATDIDDGATNNDLSTFSNLSVTNNPAASGGSHLGCWGDCTSPTMGLDKYETRMVDGGFSYNRNTVDVITHHTPFPLISAQIGQTNTVTVKVYDEYGAQGIRLVQFGLGLPEIGSPLDNAEAIIGIWLEYGGNNVEKSYNY